MLTTSGNYFFLFFIFLSAEILPSVCSISKAFDLTQKQTKKSHLGSTIWVSQNYLSIPPTVFLVQMRSGITRNCVAFSFAYQKEEVLEQHVHTWRADNPAICYFTRHLQVTHSSHTTHSGQYCESSTLHCSEHHVPRLLWRKILHWFLLCYSDIPLPILTLNWIHIFLPPIYRFILNASFRNLYAVQF